MKIKINGKLLLLILILLFSISIYGVECNNCIDCSSKINSELYDYIELNQTININRNCIETSSNKSFIFDCNGNSIIGNNTGIGIFLNNSENNNYVNCSISNFSVGISVFNESSNNTFRNNFIINNTLGLHFVHDEVIPENNTFYNNLFNNSYNVNFSTQYSKQYWNSTLISEKNVLNQTNISGNAWFLSNGSGFSDTCKVNGTFCNSYLELNSNNTDHKPLAFENITIEQEVNDFIISDCEVISEPGNYILNQSIGTISSGSSQGSSSGSSSGSSGSSSFDETTVIEDECDNYEYKYYLTEVSNTKACIQINVSNVILDCNNSVISFGEKEKSKILIEKSNNVTLKNCILYNDKNILKVDNSTNVSILDSSFNYGFESIRVKDSDSISVNNINLTGSYDSLIIDNSNIDLFNVNGVNISNYLIYFNSNTYNKEINLVNVSKNNKSIYYSNSDDSLSDIKNNYSEMIFFGSKNIVLENVSLSCGKTISFFGSNSVIINDSEFEDNSYSFIHFNNVNNTLINNSEFTDAFSSLVYSNVTNIHIKNTNFDSSFGFTIKENVSFFNMTNVTFYDGLVKTDINNLNLSYQYWGNYAYNDLTFGFDGNIIFNPWYVDKNKTILSDNDNDGFVSEEFGGNDCNDNDNSIIPFVDGLNISKKTTFCNGLYTQTMHLNITSDNLVLDCAKSVLMNNLSSSSILINDRNNVTIKNCGFRDFDASIIMSDSSNISIINNDFYNNYAGIYYKNNVDNNISFNDFENNDYDIYLDQNDDLTINNNYFKSGSISKRELGSLEFVKLVLGQSQTIGGINYILTGADAHNWEAILKVDGQTKTVKENQGYSYSATDIFIFDIFITPIPAMTASIDLYIGIDDYFGNVNNSNSSSSLNNGCYYCSFFKQENTKKNDDNKGNSGGGSDKSTKKTSSIGGFSTPTKPKETIPVDNKRIIDSIKETNDISKSVDAIKKALENSTDDNLLNDVLNFSKEITNKSKSEVEEIIDINLSNDIIDINISSIQDSLKEVETALEDAKKEKNVTKKKDLLLKATNLQETVLKNVPKVEISKDLVVEKKPRKTKALNFVETDDLKNSLNRKKYENISIKKELKTIKISNRSGNSSKIISKISFSVNIPENKTSIEVIEFIPKGIAVSAKDLKFNVEPIVLQDDPIVMWNVSENIELSYTVEKNITSIEETETMLSYEEVEIVVEDIKDEFNYNYLLFGLIGILVFGALCLVIIKLKPTKTR